MKIKVVLFLMMILIATFLVAHPTTVTVPNEQYQICNTQGTIHSQSVQFEQSCFCTTEETVIMEDTGQLAVFDGNQLRTNSSPRQRSTFPFY